MATTGINKAGLSASELALCEALENFIEWGALDIAIKTLVEIGNDFPLRMEYLRLIGREINDVAALEDTKIIEIA